MATSKSSLTVSYLITTVLVATLPVLLVSYLWLKDARHSFDESEQNWRNNHFEKYQGELKQDVRQVLDYIVYRQSQVSQLLKQTLKQRVNEAMVLADGIAASNNDKPTQIKMLRASLRALKFADGAGAFTLLRSDGTLLMGQRKPHLEQQNLLPYYRQAEQQAIRAAIAQVMAKGEIYSTVRGVSDGVENNDMRLAYAKYHPVLDVLIIHHDSLSSIASAVQEDVLQRYQRENKLSPRSIFILDRQGQALLKPEVENFEQVLLDEGNQQRQLLDLWMANFSLGDGAKPYLQYSRTGAATHNLLSYAGYFDEWGWYVGAEISLDSFYAELQANQTRFDENIYQCLLFIACVLLACLLVIAMVAYRFYFASRQGFERIITFFNQADLSATSIDVDKLPYFEFQELARCANRMLTERAAYEQALKKSRQRFRLALQASNSFMWDLDLSDKQLSFSGHFFRLLGYHNIAENAGYPMPAFLDLCHPQDRKAIEQAMLVNSQLLAEKGLELRIKNAAGDYRWFYTRGGVIDEKGVGQVSRLAGIITDIHERKSLESDLQKANVVVEEASYAREQFLSSMSHELHTPLNNILGHVQLLQREDSLSEEQRQQLKLAEEAGYYLLRLINDILELSKIDSGNAPLQINEFAVKDVVQTVTDKVYGRAKDKGLAFKVELDARLPKLMLLDGFKLKQVLLNLLSNAVKYTEKGGVTLKVSVLDQGKYAHNPQVHFEVADTGMGIPDDQQKTIFQPFTQLGGANTQGTGLGLSIALRLVRSMGACLQLDSQFGRGSRFSFSLPLKASSSELLGCTEIVLPQQSDAALSSVALVGLQQTQHQSLKQAAKTGDIETLKTIFRHLEEAGLSEQDWLKYCQQLLSHFDLESLLHFLDSNDTSDEALA